MGFNAEVAARFERAASILELLGESRFRVNAYSKAARVIGDHATYHTRYDAPLTSDITGMAGPNSVWIKSIDTPARAGTLAMEAYSAA
ncbi:MAG: hypothetical protein AAFU70_11495, partial [Planctomycetota bacterium]